MEITIKTKPSHHSESNKKITILSIFLVVIILSCMIGYGIYYWKNKPTTCFIPVKNKNIRKLLQESKQITAETIQEKRKIDQADSLLKKLKQECKDRKLVNKEGHVLPEVQNLLATIANKPFLSCLARAENAAEEIKTFQAEKKASKHDSEKQAALHKHVHTILGTPDDQLTQKATNKQIQAAFDQLVENLKTAQQEWDEGQEDGKSYEDIYTHTTLVNEYVRIYELLNQQIPKSAVPIAKK